MLRYSIFRAPTLPRGPGAQHLSRRRRAGHKKSAGTEFPSHTSAREKQDSVFRLRIPLYKDRGKGYNMPANARLCRCVWRLALRMQGAGWLHTLSLLCTFYVPCKSIIRLYFPKFNYFIQKGFLFLGLRPLNRIYSSYFQSVLCHESPSRGFSLLTKFYLIFLYVLRPDGPILS